MALKGVIFIVATVATILGVVGAETKRRKTQAVPEPAPAPVVEDEEEW